jgi:hypothetical protein
MICLFARAVPLLRLAQKGGVRIAKHFFILALFVTVCVGQETARMDRIAPWLAAGAVTGLVLHQGGQRIEAKRQ